MSLPIVDRPPLVTCDRCEFKRRGYETWDSYNGKKLKVVAGGCCRITDNKSCYDANPKGECLRWRPRAPGFWRRLFMGLGLISRPR